MVNGVTNNSKIISNFLVGLDAFVFVVDKRGVITYKNDYFKKKLNNVEALYQAEHYFSFDICIIDEEQIMTYTPLKAAFLSNEHFFASAKYEEKRHSFRKVVIKSFKLDEDKLFIISYEDLDKKNIELNKMQKELDKLKSMSDENQVLKQRAEAQSVKTALINRVSSKIKETLDSNSIIKNALTETVKALGADSIAFFEKDSQVPKYKYKFKNNINLTMLGTKTMVDGSRIIVPVVYISNVLGYIVVSFSSLKRVWQNDEIELVENIASHIAVSINQASLFAEIEKQKEELKETLSRLQEAQVQLVQSEKMASLGQLVAGIAHEINTPLGAINSNNDMIKRCVAKIDAQNSVVGVLNNIMPVNDDAINRINTLVKSLKNFARLDEVELQEADLNEGINSTLDLIRHETKEKIKVVKNLGDIPRVKCHPNGINQVLMNILVNACQSIENEGVVSISSWAKDDNVYIKIADTGCGIDKANITKIFDPGFTTKGVGVGTGLGLSISYKIIQEHKGEIIATSEAGHGATFIIRLPIE